MTALVGVRSCRPDGTIQTDALMIAAAVMARGEGRTRYRWVRRKPELVVLEFLEREPSEGFARWVARCVHGCLPAQVFAHGSPPLRDWSCCDAPGYTTLVPAGWAWAGDSSLSMADAIARGSTKSKPDLWKLYPVECLFAGAIKRGMKAYAPDALPLGVRIYYPEDKQDNEAEVASIEAALDARETARWSCPVCSLELPRSHRPTYATTRTAWACPGCGAYLVAGEGGVGLAQGEDVGRAQAWATERQAAQLRAAPTRDARTDRGPCIHCGKPVAAGAPYQDAGKGKSAHPECVAIKQINGPATEAPSPPASAGPVHAEGAPDAPPLATVNPGAMDDLKRLRPSAFVVGPCLNCSDDPCSCPEVDATRPEAEQTITPPEVEPVDPRKKARHRWVDGTCVRCKAKDPGPKKKAPACTGAAKGVA